MVDSGKPRTVLMPASLSMGGQVTARFQGAAAPEPWWAKPMNSQALRSEMIRQLIQQCGIKRIVETGTFLGTTTAFFAQFGVPVVTVESHADHARYARARLREFNNVELHEGDSVQLLQRLTGEPIDRGVPTLFYLDAHWEQHLPLRDEAEFVLAHFSKAILVIDDFVVPGDAGYGFDDYGPGKRLDLEYLQKSRLPPNSIYFPSASSQQESGARRGCAVVTADAQLAEILDRLAMLRRWRS